MKLKRPPPDVRFTQKQTFVGARQARFVHLLPDALNGAAADAALAGNLQQPVRN